MLSVRIFRSSVVGHECFFKCWAIELVSENLYIYIYIYIYIYLYIYIVYIYIYIYICLEERVFASGPGDLGSFTGQVIPKTLKWYLIPPCLTLSNIRYISRVKWSHTGKGVAPSPTFRCSSYWPSGCLDYGHQLYFIYIYIYIYWYYSLIYYR